MLGYRTVFHVDQGQHDVPALVREQLHSWVRSKGYDSDALDSGTSTKLAPTVDAFVLERIERASKSYRTRIEEHSPDGTWTSQLTVLAPRVRDPALVWLDINAPEAGKTRENNNRWTGTPRLVRNLLEVLPANDGRAHLDTRPRHIFGEDVFALLDVVRDGSRRGPVYVAGTDGSLPRQPWFDLVADLVRETVGLGSAYVLDAEATELFARHAGSSHAVRPGTVRTFLPEAVLDDSQDALRHRVLSTPRILDEHHRRLAVVLGRRARAIAVESVLPSEAVRLDNYFERQIDSLFVSGEPSGQADSTEVEPRPSVASDWSDGSAGGETTAGTENELLGLLRADLGASALTTEGVREVLRLARLGRGEAAKREGVAKRLDVLQERTVELREQLDEVTRQRDDVMLDLALSHEERERSDARVRYLQGKLKQDERWEDAYSQPELSADDLGPGSFADLLDWFDRFTYVVFTGDSGRALELDEQAPVVNWSKKAWEALLALEDYGRAKAEDRWARDVAGYLLNPPDGCRGYSANRHARNESDEVRSTPKFKSARVFPIPTEDGEQRHVFMGAHFKIAQCGMTSPRLHYFDDTGNSSRVYVGYIGAHLPTRKTN